MRRRYGNTPGLLMALFLLAAGGVALLAYPDGWEHRTAALIVALMGALVVWHWKDYYRAARRMQTRRIRHGR